MEPKNKNKRGTKAPPFCVPWPTTLAIKLELELTLAVCGWPFNRLKEVYTKGRNASKTA